MKKIAIAIINVLIIVFTFLFVKDVYMGFKNYKSQKEIINELGNLNPSKVEDDSSKKQEELSQKYNKLKEINDDYKFWINIDNTNINYPVVQSSNNDFYLDKDFNKNKNNYGSIFEDYYTDFVSDFNTVVYGHNTKLNNMLTNITKYKEPEFFKENNKIRIFDKDKEYKFEVFSVYTISGEDDPSYLYNLNDIDRRGDILKEIQEKSLFNVKIDNSFEKMITLITCSYEQKNTRTVVHAKLID